MTTIETAPVSPSAAAVATFIPTTALTIEPPTGIFADHEVPEFCTAVRDPAVLCGSVLRTVAAYGTAARVWSPAKPRELTLAQMLDAAELRSSPWDRWCEWIASLPVEVIDVLLAEAVTFCGMVYDRPLTEEYAVETLNDRDDLQSANDALHAMFSRSNNAALDALLDALDKKIMAHADVFTRPAAARAIAADERLCAVAWQEPATTVGQIAADAMYAFVEGEQ
jgi:hypothetical protein